MNAAADGAPQALQNGGGAASQSNGHTSDFSQVLEAIQAVREEMVDLGDQDAELVMALLRKGLRAIVDDESARHRGRKQIPPKPRRSRQESLIDDSDIGIESLDLGRAG